MNERHPGEQTSPHRVGGDFELAEVMWDAAEPCLSDEQRHAVLTALHVGEPYLAILVLVTALSRSGYPLPPDLHDEFSEWLRLLPAEDSYNAWSPGQLELRVMAADLQVSDTMPAISGDYGDATLCYFVLDDAGVADASYERQAEALRKWLSANRPSPALRIDMHINGFGDLLDHPLSPPSGEGGVE